MPNPSSAQYWLGKLRNRESRDYYINPTPENFERWKAERQTTLQAPPKTALESFQEEQAAERQEAHAAGYDFQSWQLHQQVERYQQEHRCSYGEAIAALHIEL